MIENEITISKKKYEEYCMLKIYIEKLKLLEEDINIKFRKIEQKKYNAFMYGLVSGAMILFWFVFGMMVILGW